MIKLPLLFVIASLLVLLVLCDGQDHHNSQNHTEPAVKQSRVLSPNDANSTIPTFAWKPSTTPAKPNTILAKPSTTPAFAWKTVAPLLTPRWCLGVASLGSDLYAVGGSAKPENYKVLSSVEKYDVSANKWRSSSPMNVGRVCPGVAALDGKLYAVGGQDSQTILTSSEMYDPTTNVWKLVAPIDTNRTGYSVAALGPKLYAVGGTTLANGVIVASVDSYDPSTNTWRAVAPMTTPRNGPSVAALGNKLYAVGGCGHDPKYDCRLLASAEAYDPNTDSWKAIMPLTTPRAGQLAFFNASLVVVGGSGVDPDGGNNLQVLASAEIYDPARNTWTPIAPMSEARVAFGLASLGTNVFAVGGKSKDDAVLASAETY